jgi:hypothetical protein
MTNADQKLTQSTLTNTHSLTPQLPLKSKRRFYWFVSLSPLHVPHFHLCTAHITAFVVFSVVYRLSPIVPSFARSSTRDGIDCLRLLM